jgi:hypothetical protein
VTTRTGLFALAAVCVVTAAGCADRPPAAPVEPDKARAALRTALDAWKSGRKIETLAQDRPPIVAQDFDWMAGSTLVEYDVLSEGTPEDANLRVPVKLSLKDAKGQAKTKTVNYIVGTDRTLTVFRAME